MTAQRQTPSFAYQGLPGAYSHQAGQVFSEVLPTAERPDFVPCETFEQVFDAVVEGRSLYGVVPLENSSVGSIAANYDLLWSKAVVMVGEVAIPIHHNLLGVPGSSLNQIREAYSHPVALEQCRRFFGKHAQITAVAFFDTSGAARHVSESGDASMAAVAGVLAAQEYGLEVLAADIEDHAFNSTRFGIIISGEPDVDHPALLPVAPYKVSCAVELPHEPGTLARLLTRIAELDVNLTKIESRPIPDAPWHYRFFMDMLLAGRYQDPSLIRVLREATQTYKVLGRYRPWQEKGG